MVQSQHRYTKSKPELGIYAGEQEKSFCMFQIHEPVHIETIKAYGLENYKVDVEQCIKMARVVYEQAGNSFSPWSVYKDMLAMR